MVQNGLVYNETSEFRVIKTAPATLVSVQQSTRHSQNGMPMHHENGFIKIMPSQGGEPAKVTASYTHIFGMNEFEFGEMTAEKLTLQTNAESHFQRPNPAQVTSEEAKSNLVTKIVREYTCVEPGKIAFTVHMGQGGREPVLHLQGELSRVEEGGSS